MAGTYKKFILAIRTRESNGNYEFVSSQGEAGAYQFKEVALQGIGYYRPDGTDANDWNNGWTGKDGIWSLSDWLGNPEVQDKAVGESQSSLWHGPFNDLGIKQYIGQNINGVTITESGLLAGAHLMGAWALADYLASGGSAYYADPNGTTIEKYLRNF